MKDKTKETETEIKETETKETETEKVTQTAVEITLAEAQKIVDDSKIKVNKKETNEVKETISIEEFNKYKDENKKLLGELSAQTKEKDRQISVLVKAFELGKINSEVTEKSTKDDEANFIKDIKSFI